jgi:ribosomal protein S18 acetylase RimI-like enzyme
MKLKVLRFNTDFDQWQQLLELLRSAFSFQTSRINPPSSLQNLNAKSLEKKAKSEALFLAWSDDNLVGCIFAKAIADNALYVGKHAVLPTYQGQGIGSALMKAIELYAKEQAKGCLELQVRVELTENQATFSSLGFIETQRTSHPGFETITSVTMQKML